LFFHHILLCFGCKTTMKGHQLSCSLHAKDNLHQLPINACLRSWMVGCKQTLENTVGAIKNGQSRETVNRGYKTKTNKPKTQHNMCLTPLYAQNTNNVNKTNVYYILSSISCCSSAYMMAIHLLLFTRDIIQHWSLTRK
jgi:hypothetical protein